jgi:hypothetical protein
MFWARVVAVFCDGETRRALRSACRELHAHIPEFVVGTHFLHILYDSQICGQGAEQQEEYEETPECWQLLELRGTTATAAACAFQLDWLGDFGSAAIGKRKFIGRILQPGRSETLSLAEFRTRIAGSREWPADEPFTFRMEWTNLGY